MELCGYTYIYIYQLLSIHRKLIKMSWIDIQSRVCAITKLSLPHLPVALSAHRRGTQWWPGQMSGSALGPVKIQRSSSGFMNKLSTQSTWGCGFHGCSKTRCCFFFMLQYPLETRIWPQVHRTTVRILSIPLFLWVFINKMAIPIVSNILFRSVWQILHTPIFAHCSCQRVQENIAAKSHCICDTPAKSCSNFADINSK